MKNQKKESSDKDLSRDPKRMGNDDDTKQVPSKSDEGKSGKSERTGHEDKSSGKR